MAFLPRRRPAASRFSSETSAPESRSAEKVAHFRENWLQSSTSAVACISESQSRHDAGPRDGPDASAARRREEVHELDVAAALRIPDFLDEPESHADRVAEREAGREVASHDGERDGRSERGEAAGAEVEDLVPRDLRELGHD